MPEVRRHGSAAAPAARPRRRPARRTPAGPTPSLPASASCGGEPVAQLDQQLDVQGRVGQPLVRAAAGVDQSDGRVLLEQPDAEQLLDHGAEGDPRDSRAAARRARCRTASGAPGPTSYRQGRSWLAAWMTHSASAIAAPSALRSARLAAGGWPGAEGDRVDQVGARAARGGAGSGRPAGCSGSRAPARRRRRPARDPACRLRDRGVQLVGRWRRPGARRRRARSAGPLRGRRVGIGTGILRSTSPGASARRVTPGGHHHHSGGQRGQTRRSTE